jgi:hypothetical protein
MAYRTVMQQITAGNNFDGTAPAGASTAANGKRTFAAEDAGGLFDPQLSEPAHLMGVAIFGLLTANLDGGTWTISKLTAEGDQIVLHSGTTETQFASDASERVVLLPGEFIQVVTTGMSVAMGCTVSTDFDFSGGSDG